MAAPSGDYTQHDGKHYFTGAANFDGAVTVPDGTVTLAKAKVFVSAEVTATGSEQSVAHGLAATPTAVLIVPQSHPGTPDTGAFDVAEGAHTSTNVVFTATANVTVKILAWV